MKSSDVGSLRAERLVCEAVTRHIRHDLVKAPRPRLACDLTRTADGITAKSWCSATNHRVVLQDLSGSACLSSFIPQC